MTDFLQILTPMIIWFFGVLLGLHIGKQHPDEIDGMKIDRVRWLILAYKSGKIRFID